MLQNLFKRYLNNSSSDDNYKQWLFSLKKERIFQAILKAQELCIDNFSKFTYQGFGENGAIELASMIVMNLYLLEKENRQSSQQFLSDILYGIESYTNKKFDILTLSDYWEEVIEDQSSLTVTQWHDTYNYLKDNLNWWIQMQGISKGCYTDRAIYQNLRKEDQVEWLYKKIVIKYNPDINYGLVYPTYHFYPGTPRCPICNTSMFKSVFPIGKEYRIKSQNGTFAIKRIFTCYKCQTFYAPVPGYRLSEQKLFERKIQDLNEYQAVLNHLDTLTTKVGRQDI